MLRSVKMADHMRHNAITVLPDANVIDAIHEIIVNKIVGQITCRQLLRAVKEFAAPVDPREHKDQLWGFGKW